MMRQYVYALLALCMTVTMNAQTATDSIQTMLIDSLRQQLQELKMNELMLQSALDKHNESERKDSIAQQKTRQRIDSLRRVATGVPLVIEGDTLLSIYASQGGQSPEYRVSRLQDKIKKIGKSLKITTDSIYVFESEHTSDVMCGEVDLIRVSDLDGLWSGMSRQELARQQMTVIAKKIEELHDTYGLTAKLRGLAWAVVLIVIQILLFLLTKHFVRHIRRRVIDGFGGRLKPLVIKGYEFLNIHQAKRILLLLTRVLQVALIVIQLFISLPLLFSIFPETEKFTWNMINYVWNPLQDIALSFIHYFPNLVKVVIIIYIVRWLLKGIRYYTDEIARENIKIEGFYADWAEPSYQIIRIFFIAFSVIVIWPLLPGSESGIFKGVSIFVAALFSLGSTTTIGNLISGLIITYMRPFFVGDFVRIGESEGIVVEKNAFITRLRDIKDNIITVPNNSILSMQTVNYTAAVRHSQGSIVHSDFTFTYKVPRQTIEQYLLEAADRSALLLKDPKPFVLVTTLEDFYTRYEINAYTVETHRLFAVYSELHKNILDVFREHDLEPTSSHFVSVKENK
ncbi:MAG: mechanosensitive ion channel [Prevotella sp.]|nr:mechanosensitive ion channel [Prevotella sp.]